MVDFIQFITGSAGDTNYGAYTYENLGREPYWLSQKLQISNTGAGGFIASHIARHLKSEVHFIIASDWKKNKLMTEDMFTHEFHLVDLMMDYCLKVTKGVDHVFNLSADLGGMGFIQSNHSVIMCNNTMISFNIIEAARINGVKRYFSVKVKPSVLLSDMCIFMHLDLYRDTDTSGGVPYFYRCVCKKPEHYEA
ncbi:UNVERIFIED_CONTAM: GDP-mannose 3,5-epimerase 1 [Sesamum radiatum]|uniref:GDP-mannose 3,5-epimerase 1 n=1 Tax=Sesamum radiatum TaxID=300843 RepID=A0AAW2V1H3_SESRA